MWFLTSGFLLISTILGPWFIIYDIYKFTFKLSKLFIFEVITGSMLPRGVWLSRGMLLWGVWLSGRLLPHGVNSAGVCSSQESTPREYAPPGDQTKNFQTYSQGVNLSLNSPGALFLGIRLPGRSILPGSRLLRRKYSRVLALLRGVNDSLWMLLASLKGTIQQKVIK